MIIDTHEHKKVLLELINQANFPGSMIELMAILKKAIIEAEVTHPKKD